MEVFPKKKKVAHWSVHCGTTCQLPDLIPKIMYSMSYSKFHKYLPFWVWVCGAWAAGVAAPGAGAVSLVPQDTLFMLTME